jgi:hypothetical protein
MTAPAPLAPATAFWHLWTDAAGASHQSRCELTAFHLAQIGQAAPQWNNEQPRGLATVVFTVQPAGWVGEWHENPAPQWIVPLSGRWWVEAMDGTRIEMGPGELSFGQDQGCATDAQGRTGHRSGTAGDTAVHLMCVRLQVAAVRLPCHQR